MAGNPRSRAPNRAGSVARRRQDLLDRVARGRLAGGNEGYLAEVVEGLLAPWAADLTVASALGLRDGPEPAVLGPALSSQEAHDRLEQVSLETGDRRFSRAAGTFTADKPGRRLENPHWVEETLAKVREGHTMSRAADLVASRHATSEAHRTTLQGTLRKAAARVAKQKVGKI